MLLRQFNKHLFLPEPEIYRFLYKKSYVLGGTLKIPLNREKNKQLTFNGSIALVTKTLKLMSYGATVYKIHLGQ